MDREEGKPEAAGAERREAGRADKFAARRRGMIERHLRSRGIDHPAILKAFAEVPRERFIPASKFGQAYGDHPIPIGHGQTISQPYVVALMLQELDTLPEHRVLDVGTGSGYQTALLAKLVERVYAIERIDELAEAAAAALAELNLTNVSFRTGDGSLGWSEEAPFDRIICGAGAPDVPAPWVDQLIDGGRIVLPVGRIESQVLVVVEKTGSRTRTREICGVRFVRLIGKEAWPRS